MRAIGAACRDWGFFQAVGHGVDPRLIASVQRQMRAFFAQPLAAKQAIDADGGESVGLLRSRAHAAHARLEADLRCGPGIGRCDRAAVAGVVAVVQAGDPGVLRRMQRGFDALAQGHRSEPRDAGGCARRLFSAGAHELPAAELLPEMPDAQSGRPMRRSRGWGISASTITRTRVR